jgi:hypothetical protein
VGAHLGGSGNEIARVRGRRPPVSPGTPPIGRRWGITQVLDRRPQNRGRDRGRGGAGRRSTPTLAMLRKFVSRARGCAHPGRDLANTGGPVKRQRVKYWTCSTQNALLDEHRSRQREVRERETEDEKQRRTTFFQRHFFDFYWLKTFFGLKNFYWYYFIMYLFVLKLVFRHLLV